jgi:hypothetical protein
VEGLDLQVVALVGVEVEPVEVVVALAELVVVAPEVQLLVVVATLRLVRLVQLLAPLLVPLPVPL